MSDDHHDALVEFIGCFDTLSGSPPTTLSDLSDGIMMFEALSDIAEDHFDTSKITHDIGSNWALKATNLRKLLNNLETYFNKVLHKDANFGDMAESISSIARDGNEDAIASFVELITAAAVTCENKGKYVGWIMNMDGKVQMKSVIQSSLARLEDLDDVSEDEDSVEDEFSSDGDHFEGREEMETFFGNADDILNSATQGIDITMNSEYSGPSIDSIMRERDELKAALADAKRELSIVEDTESSQKKLAALAKDLQDRLSERQMELEDVEGTLLQTKRALEDSEANVSDLTEKNRTLADELDVAKEKASQLLRAEATVIQYRKKFQEVGSMNQQMTDLEEQTAKYVSQIMELETETKKVPELIKKVEETQRDYDRVQKEKVEATEAISTKNAEIATLKSNLRASVTTKTRFEEELREMRSVQQLDANVMEDMPDIANLGLRSVESASEVKEKMTRLQVENKNLKKQLGLDVNNDLASIGAITSKVNSTAVAAMEDELKQKKQDIKKKEAEIAKLTTDKDRLEAYTKKTLAKFQEKYLVALQECKTKLKEKHDKIEQLEIRSAAEKTSQQREGKLLSATIYELGLTIMQHKLKER